MSGDVDPVGNIPFDVALDALDEGSADVAAMLGVREFLAPPRHVRTVRVQRNRAESHVDAPVAVDVPNELMVYEVWSVTAQDRKEYFMVIESTCTLCGLTPPTWQRAIYKGFYTSALEAVNAVGGYSE